MYSLTTCTPCDSTYATENALMLHLGLKHRKINDILEADGKRPVDLSKFRPIRHQAIPSLPENSVPNETLKETISAHEHSQFALESEKSTHEQAKPNKETSLLEPKKSETGWKKKSHLCQLCGKECKFPR